MRFLLLGVDRLEVFGVLGRDGRPHRTPPAGSTGSYWSATARWGRVTQRVREELASICGTTSACGILRATFSSTVFGHKGRPPGLGRGSGTADVDVGLSP